MIVPEPDKLILNGGLDDPEGIPADQIWITRHFHENSEGWELAIFYLKMKQIFNERGRRDFVSLYQDYSGSICPRKKLVQLCKMIENLETAAHIAAVNKDLEVLSTLKLGRRPKKGNKL